jgi:beta-glucosidase
VRSIAVIGPFAESQRDMLGSWAWPFAFDLNETDTIAAALRTKAGSAVRVDVAPGVERPVRMSPSPFTVWEPRSNVKPWTAAERAEQLAKAQRVARNADVVVLALGQTWDMTGEVASTSSLSLSPEQQQLMESIVAIGKPVVLVLMNGRPLDITWAAEHVPAILAIWHPGSRGGAAVANLLNGDSVPGGKLPVTWPRDVGQVPLYYARTLSHEPVNADRRYWNAKGAALYPFGFGLSYTTFTISEPRVERTPVRLGQPLRVSVDVKNTGERAGDEVVQLYIHQRAGRASRPVRELKGFRRVTLAPGEARTLTFELSADMLSYWSGADKAWVQDSARFDLWVGADSQARAHGEFEVTQ